MTRIEIKSRPTGTEQVGQRRLKMKEIKNFYETEMKCCATVVDWATLNKINDEAEYFLAYFGNYADDDRAAEYAMFGVIGGEGCGERYCIKIK